MLEGAKDDVLITAARETVLTLLLGNCGLTKSCDGTDWRVVLSKPALGLVVYDADVPAHGLRRFKGVCDLPYSPSFLHDLLHKHEVRALWDRNIYRVNEAVLQTEPFRAFVMNSQTNVVGPISGRDFVDIGVMLKFFDEAPPPAGPENFQATKGTIATGGVGLMVDGRYPVTSERVRGYNSPGSGFVFESRQGANGQEETRLHYCIRACKRTKRNYDFSVHYTKAPPPPSSARAAAHLAHWQPPPLPFPLPIRHKRQRVDPNFHSKFCTRQ